MNQTGWKERRFFILAGEASGDHHGASLMKAMTTADPRCRFAGIGGDLMVAAGLECLVPARKMALVGVVEVIRHLPFMLKVMSRVLKFVRQWQPERVVLIDYPGFNLRLAKKLHRLGVKATYYISPQLWAWKEGRVATIRSCVDQMLVIFPFEEQWYKDRGVQARFVGHPILEEPLPGMDREAFLASHGLDPAEPVLTLFPGSRKQELDRHLNLFLDAATRLKETLPNLQIVVGLANTLNTDTLPGNLAPEIKVVS
ncbi:MAG: lipid-A-disaccharide synthase, partial [Candidatus Marinimicrobia bacterium]|nr:lipid-A-disaccharide synthase [Candidatus Neomarinimicrobiota bacterium]